MASRGDMVAKLIGGGVVVAGGAGAGYLDGHFADKNIGGFGYGTAGAAALALLGVAGIGGRMGRYAGELGFGGLAGKAYVAANKKASPDGAVHGVRGALPSSPRIITPSRISEIYSAIGI